ncbi:FtsX-like permease family protein [Nonomuraea pusilla]|uniref:Putative ABC transport system permease protein n=1 Tax=Nonomuraea pusilla TaxID=46177 RepID=A0A1H7S987_9ACTN|nr:FtsX-like permease family protein [Nonomuraea pusilla]SEL69180.1 putative ABC transport system permease protein [Nonomuraea pusilla]
MRIALLSRTHAGAMGVLFGLTLSACLLVAALPRAMQGSFDAALRQSLRAAPAVQADLTVTVAPTRPAEDLHERGQFTTRDDRWREILPPALRPLVVPAGSGAGHMSAKTELTPVQGTGGQTYINLGWLSDMDRRVDWVRGHAPGAPGTMRWEGDSIPVFEVGVVDEAMSDMNLQLDQVKVLGEDHYVAVKIVGAFKAKDPSDRYWSHNQDILHVSRLLPPGKQEFEKHITTLMADPGLAVLDSFGRNLSYNWVLPINAARASALAAPDVDAGITEFARLLTLQSTSSAAPYRLLTGLPKLLDDFLAALTTAQTVMYLVLGGLLAVAIGVIVLAVQLLADRLDGTLALVRARGGSLRQVAGTGAALTAVAVVPAGLAGYALSALVPGPVLPIVHLGPALVVGCAVGFAAARLALTHRTPLHERRGDVTAARPSAKRVTLEVLVVVLALAGAYLLRTRDVTSRGLDPFLLLVPVALTLAAALVTLRCYPYPLRLLVRLTSRGRAAVPFLGLTRAARARSAAVLPVLILLPALAVSVFAAVVSDGIASTQRLASWQTVGAPIRMTSEIEIPADAIERVRRTPGVEQVVPAQTGRVQVGFGAERAEAIAVDLAGWQRLLDGAPISLPAEPAGGAGTPALVSPELRGRGAFEIGWQSRVKVATAGVVDVVPGFYTKGKFLVLPLEALTRPAVNTLLVKGDADPAALAEAVPSARVESQRAVLDAIQSDPLTATVRTTLLVVTVALAGYALVAVIVSLVLGAADRAGALAFLRALGLSDRQARRLTVLEILPMIVMTALAGLGLGLALPAALGPGVDLSSYAGDLPVSAYALDPLTPTALAAGLAAVAALGAYAHTAISRRRSLGAVLRVGDLT